ncbi:ABC transporter ATP-binding protein [Sphingobacterium hungaricum]
MSYSLAYQLRWAWNLTKGYRLQLLGVLLMELAGIALMLLFVYGSKLSIDIAMGEVQGSLKATLGWTVGSVLGGVLLRLASNRLSESIRVRMTISLQRDLIEGQMLTTWKFVKDWHTGDLVQRIQTDGAEVVVMLSQSAIYFFVTVVQLLASFGFLWTMDPMLAFMIVAISPLFLFSKLYFRKMRKLNREVKSAESNFAKVMQENLKFRVLVRALGLTPMRSQKLSQSQEDIYDLKMSQLNFSTLTQGIIKITINGGYLLTFIWGVFRLQAGQISFGTMTAFLQLVGRIQTPILQSVGFFPLFIRFRTSVDRLLELENNEKELIKESTYLSNPTKIQLENVYFRYDDNTIIDNLNAEIEYGKPTAIIGSSGKGKTTLIRLFLALIKPEKGNIWIENNGEQLGLSSEHRINFAYVPQGNTLFSGTIRENLTINKEIATEDRINYVLHLACAEFVYDLPDGIDTLVGESGYGLSEGQGQRIAIARAMMQETSIWLFDEVTSALDKDTADRLVERLLIAGQSKLILFVTHDLHLSNKCSQTIFMN